MTQAIAMITLTVRNYDEAIAYYVKKMGFRLFQDEDQGGGKRWVVVGPADGGGARLLLAKAANKAQEASVGNQTGGRVFLFLHTNDFWRDYERMKAVGVAFAETPRQEAYGTVAVFADLYGNKWDLLQLNEPD